LANVCRGGPEKPKMELIRRNDVTVLSNSGVESHQLLFPENSSTSRVTITKIVVAPGAINPRHRHEKSEQIWVALSGAGNLLLGEERTLPFQEGDVARFAEGDLHGFENTGAVAFVYLSVTSPPINFRQAYGQSWSRAE
jgi:quercetin dioxygenase-like cupin family protein